MGVTWREAEAELGPEFVAVLRRLAVLPPDVRRRVIGGLHVLLDMALASGTVAEHDPERAGGSGV